MKKIFLILSLLIFSTSCNNDDDNNVNTNPLNGKWFIDSISCFCSDTGDFKEEYILWDINTINNTINIINYFSTELLYSPPTGLYNYTKIDNTITINYEGNNLFFNFNFDNDKLILSDQPELDGPLIILTQKETECIDNPLLDYQWLADIKFMLEVNANPLGSQIIQYIYNDECVYLVAIMECCDFISTLYNELGEVICEFDGIIGLNTCPDFFDTAINKQILFNNVQD